MRCRSLCRPVSPLAVMALLALLGTCTIAAQGCEPIRFTTPINLGGEGRTYQPGHEWQLTLAYRHLESEDWYVGREQKPALAPGGLAPVFKIHTVIADAAYSVNDRLRLRVSVPFSTGSLSRIWPDRSVHEQTATGIGDISVQAESWLLDPRLHDNGNLALGLGVKAPTGSHTLASTFYTATAPVDFPADQTIQPGDGGWAVLTQAQGFRRIAEHVFGYAFGSYMISPKARSNVEWQPNTKRYWAVPDVYSARIGAAWSVLDRQRLTLSLGARMDGIPVHDLIGGGDDDTIKRTSRVIFADPGLSVAAGKGTLTISAPIRVSVNRMKSLYELKTNGLNGGGFARNLVFVSYAYRL